MTAPVRVMTVVGTRPELIRLSRVIPRLDAAVDHVLVHTGQNHDHQLNQVFFDELGIREPDTYLGIDTSSLGSALADIMRGTERAINEVRPDALLILGDTNSALSAIIAKRLQVPIYHMEAGNRSFDANVPEETNRRLVDHIADFNLPYSEHARRNLLDEGLPPRRIALTGSPMREVLDYYASGIAASTVLHDNGLTAREYFVVSAHRQENVDDPARLAALVETLRQIRTTWRLPILMSTHPRTRKRLESSGFGEIDGVDFHEPFGFFDYIHLQANAQCVLSDSGTISEEAAILGFPAVTLRDSMERPEALEAGNLVMTGLSAAEVVAGVHEVITDPDRGSIPVEYQVADASRRVVRFILSTVARHHEWAGVRSSSR